MCKKSTYHHFYRKMGYTRTTPDVKCSHVIVRYYEIHFSSNPILPVTHARVWQKVWQLVRKLNRDENGDPENERNMTRYCGWVQRGWESNFTKPFVCDINLCIDVLGIGSLVRRTWTFRGNSTTTTCLNADFVYGTCMHSSTHSSGIMAVCFLWEVVFQRKWKLLGFCETRSLSDSHVYCLLVDSINFSSTSFRHHVNNIYSSTYS